MLRIVDIQFRAALRAAGHTDDELRRLLRVGGLTAVRRGAYVAGPVPDDPVERHRLGLLAALDRLGSGVVMSHQSAAVLHGLPVWGVRLDRVQVTRNRGYGGRTVGPVHVHVAPLDDDEITTIGEFAVTVLERTVVDVARTVPFEQAVAVVDAALGATADRAKLQVAARRAKGWPGVPNARRVVAFADGRSESVGESRSRVAIAAAGLPAPIPQWEVRTADGRLRRTDFGWPTQRAVGEFDGRVKYGRLLRPGQDAGDAVFEEKVREDALRDLGLGVVRWTWVDLRRFDPVAERLGRVLNR